MFDGAKGPSGNRPPPTETDRRPYQPPAVAVPKGGGAVRGIGEKFAANPATGTGSLSVPITVSPGRGGFGPQLSLGYDSGSGNGPFGFGWSLSLPAVTRKTDKGLPRYIDDAESDEFILSGAEDLVPALRETDAGWEAVTREQDGYAIRRYRPRTEGLFARIERWTRTSDGDVHWRSISKDNALTLYGADAASRITDPDDDRRVFSWLICETRDDRGNATIYRYQPEDGAGVDLTAPHERNRGDRDDERRKANRYPKRILYGNRVPLLDGEGNRPAFVTAGQLDAAGWMFEVVFDYGDHPGDAPTPAPAGEWPVRLDPFSSYRAGFEVRTARLCRRVLMFHHFPDDAGVKDHPLVRSTAFTYRETPAASFLTAVVQSGHRRAVTRLLPPLEFEYSPPVIGTEVKEVPAGEVENLPAGIGGGYQWVDLDGEGLSGVLAAQGEGWFYKRNEGALARDNRTAGREARFAPVETVARIPAAGRGGKWQLLDLAGDGTTDLVTLDRPLSGFHERTDGYDWDPFRPFPSAPVLAWDDPEMKFVDLTGDGHADVLVAGGERLTWHPSLGEDGFGEPERVSVPADEERGPRVVFADGTQTVFLADLSGDGLSDVVRVRNGEVCYWPNLGYGRFGAKVTTADAPWFDTPDQFDPRRVRLADIDGTGPTDLIYLGRDRVRVWFNQAGNGWGPVNELPFPTVDAAADVTAVDLLGNGTACLVWSSPLAADARRPMRYVELMAAGKPHLMTAVRNNLGAETVVRYAPSTFFYLKDKYAGRPWGSRLPFPVHVVERVETFDRVAGNRFVTRHAYHDGYFDGPDREFRGFGMVEQWDAEEFAAFGAVSAANADPASHVPPVHTKTWFHTGVHVGRDHVSNFNAGQYYREPGAALLPDTVLPRTVPADEEHDACRALKGMMLRQEVYALDKTDKQPHPYTVVEQNAAVVRVQPRGGNRHPVFFTHPREAITYQYDRIPADPRVGHTFTLDVDEYGNVRKAVSVGYGRRAGQSPLTGEDKKKQERALVTFTETDTTNAIDDTVKYPGDYRPPLPAEVRTFEITGLTPTDGRFEFTDFDELASLPTVGFEVPSDPDLKRKRLIEFVRTLYRHDKLTGLLAPRELHPRALPGEGYRLAFTPGLLDAVYVRNGTPLLPAVAGVMAEGGYVDPDGDGRWWTPTGRVFFSPTATDTPAQEFDFARQHFFLPHRHRDPFGNSTTVAFDPHHLLVRETVDPVGNRLAAENDYHALQPRVLTDANGNRTFVAFDALGMVAGTAVQGTDATRGDTLAGFDPDPAQDDLDGLYDAADPTTPAADLLKGATTRVVYDLHRYHRTRTDHPNDPAEWRPVYAATIARETHVAPPQAAASRVQVSFTYSDGFGREVQSKIQAEPERVGGGPVVPRWVGSGWTVFDNKGQPVRKYEPFFSRLAEKRHRYEPDVRAGVSPVLFYDSVGRVVATLHPDDTFEKVVFDPWRQRTFDPNDTATLDPRTDPDIAGFVAEYFKQQPATWQTWHAQRQGGALGTAEQDAAAKAAAHANTPAEAHFDALGRTVLTFAHNGFGADAKPILFATRVTLDIEGNQRDVTDAHGRVVMRYDYDVLGRVVRQASQDAGPRWTLPDATGQPLRSWDARGHAFRTESDALRRPLRAFVVGADPANPNQELLTERWVYGEKHPLAGERNLRGRAFLHMDQAGAVRGDEFDFKGNPTRAARLLAREYTTAVNWAAVDAALTDAATVLDLAALDTALRPLVESDVFASATAYDALNRPTAVVTPHTPAMTPSVVRPTYNEANLLERLDVQIRGAKDAADNPVWTPFVANIDYDAKGQRTLIEYGSGKTATRRGVTTTYEYDDHTFRLVRLSTRRDATAFPDDTTPTTGWPGNGVQDLHYTYDAVGNVTRIRDEAQQTIYFRNTRVEPSADYKYDPLYRLIEATGREQFDGGKPVPHSSGDFKRVGIPHRGDGNAMDNYTEGYEYDAVGNILAMTHAAGGQSWARAYEYGANNRLTRTTVTGGGTPPLVEDYTHDAHGNVTRLPHLAGTHPAPNLHWDHSDQLRRADTPGGGTVYHTYDSAGQRVRKVWVKSATLTEERIYLGGVEIYRRTQGAAVLERETLHVMDDTRRIAMVETRTQDTAGTDPVPAQLTRYQFGNHLGSAAVELDADAAVISYEEYTPYGSTAYQAVQPATEVPKRYRFTGKERDEETGLYYHGARYYAPWLGRWVSCDPAGLVDGPNVYAYVRDNPAMYQDETGQNATGGSRKKYRDDFIRRRTDQPGVRNRPGAAAGSEAWKTPKSEKGWYKNEGRRTKSNSPSKWRLPGSGRNSGNLPNVQVGHPIGKPHHSHGNTGGPGRPETPQDNLNKYQIEQGRPSPEKPVPLPEPKPQAPAHSPAKPPTPPPQPAPAQAPPAAATPPAAPPPEAPPAAPKIEPPAAPKPAPPKPPIPEAPKPGVPKPPAAPKGPKGGGGGVAAGVAGGLGVALLVYDLAKAKSNEERAGIVVDTAVGAGALHLVSKVPVAGPWVAAGAAGLGLGVGVGTFLAEEVIPDSAQAAYGGVIVEHAFGASSDDIELLEKFEIGGWRPFAP